MFPEDGMEVSCPAFLVKGVFSWRNVGWYNSERSCWALDYMTPDAFYEVFMAGDVER